MNFRQWFPPVGSLILALAVGSVRGEGGEDGEDGDSSRALDLPATMIFDKGPNRYNGEVLEITKGRGSTIGWYVEAEREEEVRVFAEYTCEAPLNQAYQLSFDGENRFWEVEPTPDSKWRRAELGTFRLRAGLPVLVLLVPPSGTKYPHPVRFRKLVVEGATPGNLSLAGLPGTPASPDGAPGFGRKLDGPHPALSVRDLRDETRPLRISGMALRGEGELLLTTWDGELFAVDLDDLAALADGETPPFRRIARGLSEPMGLAVSGDRIFVTEKNQVSELIDEDGDGDFETIRCVSQDWPATMDYHEYLFGAVIRGRHLYFCNSVGMARRGKDNYQAPLRGSLIRVNVDSGETEVIAGGFRTPDGVGAGPGERILVTDNQGEWLPANKLTVVEEGAFYGFRSIPPRHPFDEGGQDPPSVWLPQGEIAASPSQPVVLPDSWGPYGGQVLFGDVTYGGLQRVFLEEVEGVSQGAVFRFSQGFRHRFHRLVFGPDGTLYAGGIARGKDQEFIERVSGLTRIEFTGENVFEPLAARIRSNGLEIEFTEPLAENAGWDPSAWHVTRWGYQPTQTYGGRKVRHRLAEVRSATVSDDQRRVFLEMPDLVEGEVVHVRLARSLASASGRSLRSGDLWYTANRIPEGRPGDVRPVPSGSLPGNAPYFEFTGGDVGATVFRNFCSACHSLDGTKLAGPTFRGIAGSTRLARPAGAGKANKVETTRAYLRQSILEPNALLVDGYLPDLMPPMGDLLTADQVDAVVDYLMEQGGEP